MDLTTLLANQGIAHVERPYADDFVDDINRRIDALFASRETEHRSYVSVDELAAAGLLTQMLGGRMRAIILSLMSNPVLYHCHIYEIAGGSAKPHIFDGPNAGWHRDYDSEYAPGRPSHLSIFVYLSDVGSQNGPFELCMQRPTDWIGRHSPTTKVIGAKGLCVVWNRAYFHRANPNLAPTRRRLFKISVQPHGTANRHIDEQTFADARRIIAPGDAYMDSLLGRSVQSALLDVERRPVAVSAMTQSNTFGLPTRSVVRQLVKANLNVLRDRLTS